MKSISKILLLALCLLTVGTVRAASPDQRRSVTVRGFKLLQERQRITVDFTLEIGQKAAGSSNTLILLPILRNGGNEKALTPVIVRGRRAEILYRRRSIASPHTVGLELSEVRIAKNGESLVCHAEFPFEEWMPGSTFVLEGVDEGCCQVQGTDLGVIADRLIVPESDFMVEETILVPERELTTGGRLAEMFPFVRAEGSGEEFSREGVTVYFEQDRYQIDPDYRHNRASLVEILSVVEEIRRSADSEVARIVIAGFASPEGSSEHNRRLSGRRAEAVSRFILDNSTLPTEAISTYVGGEDWQGLRELVAASSMWEKEAVLDIIDHVPVWDGNHEKGREAELMRLNGGEPYRYMYQYFFRELREAAYITVYYKDK